MTYDVIIIGAGPAGSTVSTLLSRAGLRALLLEKSRFPREKLCGEFIENVGSKKITNRKGGSLNAVYQNW